MNAEQQIRLPRPADVNFSDELADRAVDFFSKYLHHTKGQWSGKPFELREWQKTDIREIFGRIDDDGNRLIRQAYVEVPKKNGKSEIAAGIALKLLFADREPGAEVYGAGADRDQASIVYSVAASMVRRNRSLRSRSKIVDSTKRIAVPRTESFYRAVSSEVAGKHGFNSSGVIFDEVHAQKEMRLWEVLTFGAGDARRQPLTYAITTAGIPGESPVAEMLHEDADQILRGIIPCPNDFYPVIYSAPADWKWDDEEVWHYCNPALGDFLNLDSVRKACETAKRRPTEENSFRRLRLNQWLSQEVRWIPMSEWDACDEKFDWRDLRDVPCYIGIDLSTKLDLTSLSIVWLDEQGRIFIRPYFWIPAESWKARSNIESDKYSQWIKQGFIETTPGKTIDFAVVRQKANEIRDEMKLDVQGVAYDPMFATQLAQQLDADAFEIFEFRPSFTNFTPACVEFEAAWSDRRLLHNKNPVLRWNADCVTVKQHVEGGIRPIKPERLKSRKRIDGIVASLQALGLAVKLGEGTDEANISFLSSA